jgi:hypothetical protein
MKTLYFHRLFDYFTSKKALNEFVVFHGTHFDFDSFRTDKEYTGIGAQGFGWGLYFTESKSLAKSFAEDTLNSEVVTAYIDGVEISKEVCDLLTKGFRSWGNKPSILIPLLKSRVDGLLQSGKISKEEASLISSAKKLKIATDRFVYTVELPDTAKFLDWKGVVTEDMLKIIVSQMAKEGYKGRLVYEGGKMYKVWGGKEEVKVWKDLYYALAGDSNQKEASMFLSRAGISGIRYSDGGSTNYVVFDPKDIKIVKKESF